MRDPLDDEQLFRVLLDGARTDFSAGLERVAGERVYGVALVVTLSLSWARTAVCTEEGLDQVVQRWAQKQPHRARDDLRRACSSLPCESPHWDWSSTLRGLEPASESMAERWEAVGRLADAVEAEGEDSDTVLALWDERTLDVLKRVLTTLEDEGLFGSQRVHLGIEMATSPDELIELSQELNPPSVHARYAAGLQRPADADA